MDSVRQIRPRLRQGIEPRLRITDKTATESAAQAHIPPQRKPKLRGSVWGVIKMHGLRAQRPLARAVVVLFGLGFASTAGLAAEHNAANNPPGADLTRYEIAEWHDKLYESTLSLIHI